MVTPAEIFTLLADTEPNWKWFLLIFLFCFMPQKHVFHSLIRIVDHISKGTFEFLRLLNAIGLVIALLLVITVKVLDLISRYDDEDQQ